MGQKWVEKRDEKRIENFWSVTIKKTQMSHGITNIIFLGSL